MGDTFTGIPVEEKLQYVDVVHTVVGASSSCCCRTMVEGCVSLRSRRRHVAGLLLSYTNITAARSLNRRCCIEATTTVLIHSLTISPNWYAYLVWL